MGDSSWAIEASISRLENATRSEAHPAPHGCRHPVGTTDSEIALQQLRRAVLGSRCGSRRYRRRCVTFDTEPPNGDEDCSGEGGQRKERRRETILGTRHGTPLRRALDFHSPCISLAITDVPPSSSSLPTRADVDRTTIQQRRQFRPRLLLSVDVNAPTCESKQLAARSQVPWTPSPSQNLDERPSDNTPLIRRRSPIAASPGAASTATLGRISKQLATAAAAAAAAASPSSSSPRVPPCTAVAATGAAAGAAAASSTPSPRGQMHEQQHQHSDQASYWPHGPSSGGSRQSRSARLKLLLQRTWEETDPQSHLYYSPSGRRTSPSPSSSPKSWPSPATCPGRKATCTAEPFRNASIS